MILSTPAPEQDTAEILDSLCIIDLWFYINENGSSETVGKCDGATCNYCGRYNVAIPAPEQP